jgi:Subtilase family
VPQVWLKRALTSRRGNRLDLIAPGEYLSPSEQSTGGTSFATGVVTGALAAWRSVCPTLEAVQIETKLKQFARLTIIDEADRNADKVGKGMVFIPAVLDCTI